MTLIEQPWARVRQPVPIPGEYTVDSLRQMPDLAFAQLLQSHLVPREQTGPGRRAWEQLWLTVRDDDELADRAYDVLDAFLDSTQAALDGGHLDPDQRKRADKFHELCQHSWQRIGRSADDQPLAWAGPAGQFSPAARRVIATLIAAIARHRSAVHGSPHRPTPADQDLWAVMRRVNLDPADYDRKDA